MKTEILLIGKRTPFLMGSREQRYTADHFYRRRIRILSTAPNIHVIVPS
ncbi:hypothetical protein RGU70_10575 [Herbaspirillum sp. RTI4]|nr:hypothetical protein [Herbaspirillum sp. RTI4]MDY7578764.1 hypothetical protein [Herbaspirillum sp. RTI4]MEA9982316.1 hypothetical protein [Herbaspirillum sp. RTI4]